MTETKRVGDLEINQDLDYTRRLWTIQRVGWVVMAAVVLAALLGFLGPGLLSTSEGADDEDSSLAVEEYEQFLRFYKPTDLRVRLEEGAGTGGEARIWLDRRYMEGVQVQQVTPEPESVEAGPDRLTYVFNVEEPDQPTAVTFSLQPETFGRLQGQVGLEGEEPISFEQFVYP